MENLPAKKTFSSYFQLTEENDDAITKWLKSISFFSAIFALLIFTDFFLPLKKEDHNIEAMKVRNGFSEIDYAIYQKLPEKSGEEEFWLILTNEELAISEENMEKLILFDKITLYKTSIFGINVKFQNTKFYPSHYYYPYFNVYGFLVIIPCILILFFILMRIFSKKSELVMSIGVLNIFLLVGFGFLLLFY